MEEKNERDIRRGLDTFIFLLGLQAGILGTWGAFYFGGAL